MLDLPTPEKGNILADYQVHRSLTEAKPDFVFHMAAQTVVLDSLKKARPTIETNLMGTVNVLEALRRLSHPCAAIFITTDKVYENVNQPWGYRECDRLGAADPYSTSKACAELAIATYREQFFSRGPVRIATARAGNVIGGGDYTPHRIVPDCVRALTANKPIVVRSPHATRPFGYVLDVLYGYMTLAAALATEPPAEPAFNFGPNHAHSVEDLLTEFLTIWPGKYEVVPPPTSEAEAATLSLANTLARLRLGWTPALHFPFAVQSTAEWYRRVHNGLTPQEVTSEAITDFENLL